MFITFECTIWKVLNESHAWIQTNALDTKSLFRAVVSLVSHVSWNRCFTRNHAFIAFQNHGSTSHRWIFQKYFSYPWHDPGFFSHVSNTYFFTFSENVSGNRCFTNGTFQEKALSPIAHHDISENAVVSLSHGKSLSKRNHTLQKILHAEPHVFKNHLSWHTVTFQTFQNENAVL